MRRLGLVAAVVMTLTVVAGTSSASPPTRTPRSTTTAAASNTTTWWVDSTWISPLTGWVLGEGKASCPSCILIRYTNNGGRSWSAVPTPGARLALSTTNTYLCGSAGCVTRIVFANRNDGYLFGPDLFTTTDGGRTWHRQGGKPTVALAIVDPGVVWRLTYANCPGPCGLTLQQQRTGTTSWVTVRASFDGSGNSVDQQIVGLGSGRRLIAFYENIADGSVAVGTFFFTADQGRTWSRKRDPCAPYRSEDASVAAADGTLVVECEWEGNSVPAYVIVSRNGGETYGPQRAIPKWNAFVIASASANTIVAATAGIGGSGLGENESFIFTLERSSNGGVTWRTVVRDREMLTSSTPGGNYLSFVSQTVGHWIGYGNKLWTTTDGGEHWTASNV